MKRNSLLLPVMVLFACSVAFAKGDIKAGKTKSATCAACHQPDGNSVSPLWPKLAGQNEKYLVKQMRDLKKGHEAGRFDPSMSPLMQALSEQDIQDIAAYFAAQEVKVGVADKELVNLGKRIYQGGDLETHVTACTACHGPRGEGNHPAGFPALSGQQAQYTEKQLHDFKKGNRMNSPAQIMHQIAMRMNDKEIKAVASYIQGLY